MEFLRAFIYMFKSKNWYIALLIGILLEIPTFGLHYFVKHASQTPMDNQYYIIMLVYLISIPINLLISTLIGGYYLVNANRRTINPEAELLQWSSIKDIILTGLKSMGASFIYCIPYMLISLVSIVLYFAVIFGTMSKPTYNYMIIPGFLGIIMFVTITTIATPAFVTNLKFKSYFNFKLMFNLVKNNPKGFGILVTYSIIVSLIAGIASLFNNYITLVFTPILAFYFTVVKSELVAMYIRGAAKNNQ